MRLIAETIVIDSQTYEHSLINESTHELIGALHTSLPGFPPVVTVTSLKGAEIDLVPIGSFLIYSDEKKLYGSRQFYCKLGPKQLLRIPYVYTYNRARPDRIRIRNERVEIGDTNEPK